VNPLLERIGERARGFGVARWTIVGFLLLLAGSAWGLGLDLPQLASKSLWRVGMNLILCLAMLPMIRGGTGLNFGLPIGVVGGLLAVVLVLEHFGLFHGQFGDDAPGVAFAAAIGLAIVFAIPFGILYGLTLNAVRGNEMVVGIYLGWAAVSLFSMVWLEGPFANPKLVWALGGDGLRTTLQMRDTFGEVLDGAFAKQEESIFGGFRLRLGLLLFVGAVVLTVWYLFRTRLGVSINAAGENPRFAVSSGLRVSRTRIVAITFSTVLAAVGTVVFCQSYGFAQLYQAPLHIALPAAAAVLIGGASLTRITLGHVLIGVLLFQSILTLAPPVLNEAFEGGDMNESLRLTIQNGMILYALTRVGGSK